MKIVVINGSGTGTSGATGKTLVGVVDGAHAAEAEVETFLLAELIINPCKGCKTCQKTGQCVIDDDYPKISEAMMDADGLVLASPNYISNVACRKPERHLAL
jgi:multimeric flavodoxin WrbA